MSLNETLLPQRIKERPVKCAEIVSIDHLRKISAPKSIQTTFGSGRATFGKTLSPNPKASQVIPFEDLIRKRNQTSMVRSLSRQTGLGMEDATDVIEALERKGLSQNQPIFRDHTKRSIRRVLIVSALVIAGMALYFF